MSQVGYVANHSMRLIEGNTLEPSPVFYLFYQNIEAKTDLTSYGLEWPEGDVIRSKLHMGNRKWPDVRIS